MRERKVKEIRVRDARAKRVRCREQNGGKGEGGDFVVSIVAGIWGKNKRTESSKSTC